MKPWPLVLHPMNCQKLEDDAISGVYGSILAVPSPRYTWDPKFQEAAASLLSLELYRSLYAVDLDTSTERKNQYSLEAFEEALLPNLEPLITETC